MTEKDASNIKTVKIDGCIHKRLKLFAFENNLSISDVVNALLYCADKNGLDASYGYAVDMICNEPPHPSVTSHSTGISENKPECPTSKPVPIIYREDGFITGISIKEV